ncbi:MAG: hypothetical protein A2937_03705 [Candidatus Yonathbacteria bacterium RIFCSPLOWO2_01_FULL_47_33b]|uniref:Uncharacterized protein n=1 Tax=Candidatus Yonathbacteria bacterium RIFCSPLOWO2_01_FULL_47_33b TaxID=1802727 RepID=A0A1G2SG64_9BACT|nr:MAG: hypothetical protein A2937_03705 [Candidatus Yonathbacteria bacterium RIFCSPLOWO2_01_FULL_47_33b]
MRLYEEEFNEPLSEDEAREITSRLVELYMMLAEPLPSERLNPIPSPQNSPEVVAYNCAQDHQ